MKHIVLLKTIKVIVNGRECLTELTKALEDYRDDLVVIVAGYDELMKKFFESNPGLKSRF